MTNDNYTSRSTSLRKRKEPDDDDTDGMYGFSRATDNVYSMGGPRRFQVRKTYSSMSDRPKKSKESRYQMGSTSTAASKQRAPAQMSRSTLTMWKAVIERTCKVHCHHNSHENEDHCSDEIEPKPDGGDLTIVEAGLTRKRLFLCV